MGDAEPAWACGHWNAPRPLYGLDRLAARPADRVGSICEGEKAADAAGRLLPGYVAVHGLAALSRSPKPTGPRSPAGRSCSGRTATSRVGSVCRPLAAILAAPQGLACTVRILDSNQMSPGWDAADAEAEGWSTDELVEWAKPRARDYLPPAALQAPQSAAAPTPSPDSAPAPSAAPSPPQPCAPGCGRRPTGRARRRGRTPYRWRCPSPGWL